MQANKHNRLIAVTAQGRTANSRGVGCVLLIIIAFAHLVAAQTPSQAAAAPITANIHYSIICVIHGDGEYLFHDSSGDEHMADVDALAKAGLVATRNPQSEMFIFHQLPRTHYLLFFPQRDGECFYYRGGELVAHESYWRQSGLSRFAAEAELYNRFRVADAPAMQNIFLYFGHEIPEFGGVGYDQSFPNRAFTLSDFTAGLALFAHDSLRFDLFVLSTCFNGSPHTIAALAPFARYIVASPENLHLSYFDLQPLEHLELASPQPAVLAAVFARNAFSILARTTQTAVSVGVYDADRAESFLHYANRSYSRTLAALARVNDSQSDVPAVFEHCDCADNAAYNLNGMSDGVEILFRPAQFGRSKNKSVHSGWECWKESLWETHAMPVNLAR